MNLRPAALLVVPLLAVTLAGCSSESTGSSSTGQDAAAQSGGSAAASASAGADGAAGDGAAAEESARAALSVEGNAVALSQRLMGFAAETSRKQRKVPAGDPDMQLFSFLSTDAESWAKAARRMSEEPELMQVDMTIDGVSVNTVKAAQIDPKDGLVFAFKDADESCSVNATFIDAGDITGLSWEEPVCTGSAKKDGKDADAAKESAEPSASATPSS